MRISFRFSNSFKHLCHHLLSTCTLSYYHVRCVAQWRHCNINTLPADVLVVTMCYQLRGGNNHKNITGMIHGFSTSKASTSGLRLARKASVPSVGFQPRARPRSARHTEEAPKYLASYGRIFSPGLEHCTGGTHKTYIFQILLRERFRFGRATFSRIKEGL